MKSLIEYIQESMLKHVAIELKDYDLIYEKYGLYNGCKELIKFIKDKLKEINSSDETLVINYQDVSEIENIVFDKLVINLIDTGNKLQASYKPKQLPKDNNFNENDIQYIDKETKRFNEVIIEINTANTSLTHLPHLPKLDSILAHELTHIFNDYRIQVICKNSFVELFDAKSYRMSKEFNDKSKPKPMVERELERALYMLNEYEKNGFIASLTQEIEEIKEAYGNKMLSSIEASEIYASIQATEIYKNYMEIGRYIEDFYNDNLTKFKKERILSHWNKIFDDNKTTLESIFKILPNKFIKLKRKLESTLPKKIAEELILNHNEIVIY